MTHAKEVSVPWAQIVAAVVTAAILGSVTTYAAIASMRSELTSTTARSVHIEGSLNEINTRLSRIEGALGVK